MNEYRADRALVSVSKVVGQFETVGSDTCMNMYVHMEVKALWYASFAEAQPQRTSGGVRPFAC